MARYIIRDGRLVSDGQEFELDGVLYPSTWLRTPEGREIVGASEVVEALPPTGDFIFVSEDADIPGAWKVTPFTEEQIKAELIALAKELRKAKETGGIVFNGIPVETDDPRSQLKITQSFNAAQSDPQWTTDWAVGDVTYPIDATTMIAIAGAVGEHINTCFKTFSAVVAEIKAGTITTKDAVRAAFA